MKTETEHPYLVDPAYKMKYYGTILDLDDFFGPIKIYTSTFENNFVRYSSCDAAPRMSANVFYGTDNYSLYGTKTDLQIRPLISVVNHKHKFEMVENDFNYNSGTKGIIFLDFAERTTNPVYISGNTFL